MTEEILVKKGKSVLPVWARIVLSIIAFVILGGIFQFIGMLIMKVPFTKPDAVRNLTIEQLTVMQFFGVLALVLVVYIFRRHVDKESIMSMGFALKNRLNDIVLGLVFALFIIGGGSLILYALNYIDFQKAQMDIVTLILSFILFILVALNEEVFLRGYILNNLMNSMNKFWALLISAIIFSLFHGLNSNLSILALINLMLAGVILGSTYIFTKNLWFPISLHLFWNFFQGPVFGYSVSGQKIDSLVKVNLLGSSRNINGGEFGFEGSIVCTILLVVAIGAIITYYIKTSGKHQLTKVI